MHKLLSVRALQEVDLAVYSYVAGYSNILNKLVKGLRVLEASSYDRAAVLILINKRNASTQDRSANASLELNGVGY